MPRLEEGTRRVSVGLKHEIIEVSRVDGEKEVKVRRGGAPTEYIVFSRRNREVYVRIQQHGSDSLLNAGFTLGIGALEAAVNELKSRRQPANKKSPRR